MVSSFHREIKRVSGLKPDWGLCRQTRAGEGHPHGTSPIDEAGAFETQRDHSRAATRKILTRASGAMVRREQSLARSIPSPYARPATEGSKGSE
jgi:hypothetical protein